jgi:hypothetical protein
MREDHNGEMDETLRREARDAIVQRYIASGDTANACRLRVIAAIQDQMRRDEIQTADLDQIFVLFNETSDEIVEAKLIGTLIGAEERGQLPADYRQRVMELARTALSREHWLTRHSGCTLLFAVNARSERDVIMPLLEDQNEHVRTVAAQVLARWADRPPESI